jgi:uncharacterized protein
MNNPAEIQNVLARLYASIDAEAHRIAGLHACRLLCKKSCASCCVDDISVFEIEAEHIRQQGKKILETEKPHQQGSCAFLDKDNSCRIYEVRPYVCRTQGLPLHWLEDRNGTTVALRDICPLNNEGTPVEQLPEDSCWKIGMVEEHLAALQYALGNREMNRVRLRALFDKQ